MTGSVPYLISGNSAAASASPLTLAVGTATGLGSAQGAAAGDTVTVIATANSGTVTVGPDSKGNTYTLRASNTSVTSKVFIFDSVGISAALVSGTDTIPVNYSSGSASQNAIARGCNGIASADTATPNNASGTSAAPSVATAAALTQASEWAVAGLANGNGGGTPSAWSGGFTAIGTEHNGTGQFGTAADQVTTSTSALTAAATISSTNWSMAVATYQTSLPTISTSSLAGGTTGTSYSHSISASGGVGTLAYSISSGSLPTGLSISSSTGAITGTPHTAGTSSFTAEVTDGNGSTATKSLSIVISSNLAVTTSSLPDGTEGSAYSQSLAASGGFSTYSWAVTTGSLPSSLTLSSATISGTPSAAGTSSFTVTVTDAGGNTATQNLSIVIAGSSTPAVFPDAVLGLIAELNLDGTWTDISDHANHSATDSQSHPAAVVITRGRTDETTTTANPSTAAFELDNRDGKFCGRNPASPYYGQLGRNTPVRWSVPSSGTYLRIQEDKTGYISTPDSSATSITGDIDIRVEFDLTDWSMCAIAQKWETGEQSWYVQLNTDGTITLFWSSTGSNDLSATSTSPLPLGHHALKVTLDVNNGSSGNTVTFYVGTTIALNDFAQLGDAVTQSGTTGIFDSTSSTKVGRECSGSFYRFSVRDGIGGTLVASPNFTTATAGDSSLTDAQSNVWTVSNSAEFSDREYRIHAEMSAIPVTWDPTAQDVWTNVSAAGPLRRLQQGQQPLAMSAMRRALESKTGDLAPVSYWPLEDIIGSEAMASAIGGQPMVIGGTPTLAGDPNFNCSNPIPLLAGGSFSGSIPKYSGGTSFVCRFLMDTPSSSSTADQAVIARVFFRGGKIQTLTLRYASGGALELTGWDGEGNNLFDSGTVAFAVEGEKLWVSVELQIVSGNLQWSMTTLQPGSTTGLAFSLNVLGGGTIGTAWGVQIAPNQDIADIAIGHVSIQKTWESLFDDFDPLNAWKGETAGNRFIRICNENGLIGRVYGYPDQTVPMGAQKSDTLLNLLQSCEDTDRGQIYEPREVLALAYRTLSSLCSQSPAATLDYDQDHLAPPLLPTDDDLYTVNDVTVTGTGGGSFRTVLDDGSRMSISLPQDGGTGQYGNSYNVNVHKGVQLNDEAGWILRTGTVDEERYPSVVVNLASTQDAISDIYDDVAAVDVGDFIQIINTPSFLPPGPVNQLCWGSTESLGDFCREIEWNTIPESPYEVGVVDTFGQADTDGSTLSAGVTTTATTIHIASTDDNLWTTTSADRPFDLFIGGERMTVTALSGTSSPQSATVTRSVNGVVKAHSSGDVVAFATPAVVALI